MSLSRLQTRSYPSWAINTCFNDLYSTHGLPLCRFLLAAQFADLIEGACRLPPLRPLLCNYQTIYKTWQAHKEARQRPGAWHLNLHEALPFGGQIAKVGGAWIQTSPSLLSTKGFVTRHCDGALFILLLHWLFCSFVWCDIDNANWYLFYHLDVVHNKNCLGK